MVSMAEQGAGGQQGQGSGGSGRKRVGFVPGLAQRKDANASSGAKRRKRTVKAEGDAQVDEDIDYELDRGVHPYGVKVQ